MSLAEILTWIYLIGVAVSWPFLARTGVRSELKTGPLDGVEMAALIFVGLCVAFLWPIIIPGYWIWEWLQKEITESEQ